MTRLGFLPVACLLFAAALGSAQQQPAAGRSFHDRYAQLVANPRRLSDSTRLGELFRVNWEYLMTEFPKFATYVGYPGQNARWTDNSLQAIERRKRELEEPLAVVKAIRRDRLSPTDRLNYDLFRRGLEEQIEGTRFKDEYFAVTQLDGVQQDVGRLLAQMPTTSVQDYENILARLNGVPALVDQAIVLLGKGLEAGITMARSEEHTSELQSLAYLVCRLLLEKKKKATTSDCKTNVMMRLNQCLFMSPQVTPRYAVSATTGSSDLHHAVYQYRCGRAGARLLRVLV